MTTKPWYKNKPIGSIETLSRILGVHPKILIDITKKITSSYTSFQIETKGGKIRDVFEPKFELKKIQKRINANIFEFVSFPDYLTGGIRDEENPRDWVYNAKLHTRSGTLIKLDIKNFYQNISSVEVERVFKNFFNFADDVVEVLTKLTTLNGRVPQGACTSSYIANLIFFDTEYSLVSKFLSRELRYSRLLDDITISSIKEISADRESEIIKLVASMCRKRGLRFNRKKLAINRASSIDDDFKVTGAWVRHGRAKLLKDERRYVRQLVYACECSYKVDPSSEEIHELWNRASGMVAKMKRLGHKQSDDLRLRLSQVLPVYDDHKVAALKQEITRLCKLAKPNPRVGHLKRVNRAYYYLGILGRTQKILSKELRKDLNRAYGVHNNIKMKDYWV